MNIKEIHTQNKAVQTKELFEPKENVIALQIEKNEILKEHITKIPALLVCISGKATYNDENNNKQVLENGSFVNITPFVKHWVEAQEKAILF